MSDTREIQDEISLLLHFDLHSLQEGVKVHSTADLAVVAAAQRLFAKGLTSQVDGGYLTSLGISAAEHAQNLMQILSTE